MHTVFALQVSTSNPSAPGWSHVVQMYDSFKLTGPHGTRILPQMLQVHVHLEVSVCLALFWSGISLVK